MPCCWLEVQRIRLFVLTLPMKGCRVWMGGWKVVSQLLAINTFDEEMLLKTHKLSVSVLFFEGITFDAEDDHYRPPPDTSFFGVYDGHAGVQPCHSHTKQPSPSPTPTRNGKITWVWSSSPFMFDIGSVCMCPMQKNIFVFFPQFQPSLKGVLARRQVALGTSLFQVVIFLEHCLTTCVCIVFLCRIPRVFLLVVRAVLKGHKRFF